MHVPLNIPTEYFISHLYRYSNFVHVYVCNYVSIKTYDLYWQIFESRFWNCIFFKLIFLGISTHFIIINRALIENINLIYRNSQHFFFKLINFYLIPYIKINHINIFLLFSLHYRSKFFLQSFNRYFTKHTIPTY